MAVLSDPEQESHLEPRRIVYSVPDGVFALNNENHKGWELPEQVPHLAVWHRRWNLRGVWVVERLRPRSEKVNILAKAVIETLIILIKWLNN